MHPCPEVSIPYNNIRRQVTPLQNQGQMARATLESKHPMEFSGKDTFQKSMAAQGELAWI